MRDVKGTLDSERFPQNSSEISVALIGGISSAGGHSQLCVVFYLCLFLLGGLGDYLFKQIVSPSGNRAEAN